jgi:hypothetical protein
LPALANDFGDEVRIGVGSLLRRAIPRDVRLDDYDVLASDESADPAEIFESLLDQSARFSGLWTATIHRILRDGKVRPLLIGSDAMIFARLLGRCGRRAMAPFAEPDARPCHAGRDTPNAQKLQQSLAPRELRSLRGAGIGC